MDVYTESSLDRNSSEHVRTHKDELFTGILTPKQDGETTDLVFRDKDLLIQLSWQYLANSRNPSLVPGKTYTLTLRDEDSFDEEDVIAFVTDRDHKGHSELTQDSKIYVLMRIQDGGDVVFDRSTCEVHHLKMTETTVEIQYGMWGPSDVEWHCVRNFPHHRKYIQGGCNLDEEHKVGKRFICPKCVEECERYTASVSPK